MSKDIPQSEEDFNEHFKDCLRFLEDSCDSYDKGFDGEAKRLAATIRTLVHDTPKSTSLLMHLKMKGGQFLDTAHENWPDNTMTYSGLVAMNIDSGSGKGPKYIPIIDSGKGVLVDFEAWWNRVIFIDQEKKTLTRKELVLAIANKDGGAHIDEVLDEKYGNLSRRNSLGWTASQGGETGPLRAPEKASVRQIAHELLKTLKPGYEKKIGFFGVTVSAVMHSPEIRVPMPPQDKAQAQSLSSSCHCGSRRKYKKCHGQIFKGNVTSPHN